MAEPRDRDLVEALRAELAGIDPPRACCRRAERDGLGVAARGRARSTVVARLAVRLAEEGGAGPDAGSDAIDWSNARQHCRAAWLRGRFLSSASMSLGTAGTHLEFVVPVPEATPLASRLEDAGFAASVRQRRGRGVVTVKGHDAVLALLRWCGASSTVLEIESRLVTRQLQGHLNRVLNAETANLRRSVASSTRQLAVIAQLGSDGRLEALPELERAVAEERRAAPEATFSELAARLDVSRARIQRAFARIDAAVRSPLPEPAADGPPRSRASGQSPPRRRRAALRATSGGSRSAGR